MNPKTIDMVLKLIDLLALGISITPSIKSSYDEQKSKIQIMVDENRDPTQEEWEELLSVVQENTNVLEN